MVAPFRRRLKRVAVRTPGGRIVFHYRKEKPSKHVCALCGNYLHGVPHGRRPVEVRKLSKTERRPERIFGGVLCSSCTRRVIEEAFYVKTGVKEIGEVDIKMRPYVEAAMKRMVVA